MLSHGYLQVTPVTSSISIGQNQDRLTTFFNTVNYVACNSSSSQPIPEMFVFCYEIITTFAIRGSLIFGSRLFPKKWFEEPRYQLELQFPG